MGFIRFLLWTSICIGIGAFAAGWEIDGKTPVQYARQIWKATPHSVEGTIEKAKQKLKEPTEQHTDADKDAVNRLVAKRATK